MNTMKTTLKQVKEILSKLVKNEVRRLITEEKVRPDGRAVDEIRPLSSEVGLLAENTRFRSFYKGTNSGTQRLYARCPWRCANARRSSASKRSKRFMHHYNFPQFSVGETGPMRGPGRREIGHGALGERALEPLFHLKKTSLIRSASYLKCLNQTVQLPKRAFVQAR